MTRRVGIELSPFRCAIIDVEPSDRSRPASRIRTFRTIPWSAGNTEPFVATLRLLRGSNLLPGRAVVALWGVPATVQVTAMSADGTEAELRAAVLREAPQAGQGAGAETATTVSFDDPATRPQGAGREAAIVSAPVADLRSRLAPLVAAGFAIDSVVTVPLALASIGRLLHRHSGGVRAYVAVNADAMAIAVVRNGLLVFAREVPLGFNAARSGRLDEPSAGSDFAGQLAAELKRSLPLVRQQAGVDVERAYLCGEFPALRTLTAPLMHALDLHVETLDSMDGLAPAADRSDVDLRYRAGEMRVAWAIAADETSGANLLEAPPAPPAAKSRRWTRRQALAVAATLLTVAAIGVVGSRVRDAFGHRDAAATPSPAVRPAQPSIVQVNPRSTPVAPCPPVTDQGPTTSDLDRRLGRTTHDGRRTTNNQQPTTNPVVQSILFASDRRLAVIDRRTLRIGDAVGPDVIADIEPRAVILRSPSGRLRRVEMARPGTSGANAPGAPRSD